MEWGCTLAAAAVWAAGSSMAAPSLMGAALWAGGWAARWARLGRATHATAGDWALAVFLATAALGVWTAPERGTALARFCLFLGAAGLYYVLANSSPRSRAVFVYALSVCAAVLALYFASQHDWVTDPAELTTIGRLGRLLNRWVPDLGLDPSEPNVVASLLAVALPLTAVPLAFALAGKVDRRWPAQLLLATNAGLIMFGLVMVESLSSMLAVAGTLVVAGWWWLAKRLAAHAQQQAGRVFWAGLGAAAVVALLALAAIPDLLTYAYGTLPGLRGAEGRAAVYAQVWRLAQDTPFTGAGLAAFPGYYSTYALGIPVLFLNQAHSTYLTILLEQGWLGLLSLAALLACSLLAATRQWQSGDTPQRLWAMAGGLGLIAVMLQGLGEGTLVASWAALALLVPAGLSASPTMLGGRGASGRLGWRAAAGAVVVCLVVAGGLTWRTWLSAWHANWGAVEFARVQLAGWPTGEWSTGREAPRLAATRPSFERALALNPNNVTAHYRLGLLAGLERDFASARLHLELAYAADPGHRGIEKALAYTYVWLGETRLALPLLVKLPEAVDELSVYTWWWGTQDRADLAQQAQAALAALERSAPQ